jgi:DNA polymerase V
MFALVDANSFYCSAEQVFRPEWRNKPVIVLSNNDGCIVAANKQAQAAGIKKFQPYFKARGLCEKRGVIVCSSNYELYADLSAKMMQIIGRFAPRQHIYSIDESFLDFGQSQPGIACLQTHALNLRKTVWRETRLPVCVGLGETLTLAKVANHAAKRLPEYRGVCLLNDEQQKKTIFQQLQPGDVWGVGRKTARKLEQIGIKNVAQLAALSMRKIANNFNVQIERTVRELNGEPCQNWDGVRADKQQIFSSRSVGQRITDPESLQQALAKHVAIAAKKARQQGSLCATMIAFAANSPFDKVPRSFKFIQHFSPASNDTVELTKALRRGADVLFQGGIQYYKIGIGLLNLSSEKNQQLELFNGASGNSQCMAMLDLVNRKYGMDTLFLAAQGVEQKWAMRREYLTPQYTTKWRDIPRVRC